MPIADQLVDRLIKCGISPTDIRGCSDEDIKKIQEQTGSPLPESYIEFLRLIGRGAGDFMSDLTAFYPAILTLTTKASPGIAKYVSVPDDAFFIADRYGDQSMYIRLSEGPSDSTVYYWNSEKPKKIKALFKSFWGFVKDELKGFEYSRK